MQVCKKPTRKVTVKATSDDGRGLPAAGLELTASCHLRLYASDDGARAAGAHECRQNRIRIVLPQEDVGVQGRYRLGTHNSRHRRKLCALLFLVVTPLNICTKGALGRSGTCDVSAVKHWLLELVQRGRHEQTGVYRKNRRFSENW